jgi:hypothetical protein
MSNSFSREIIKWGTIGVVSSLVLSACGGGKSPEVKPVVQGRSPATPLVGGNPAYKEATRVTPVMRAMTPQELIDYQNQIKEDKDKVGQILIFNQALPLGMSLIPVGACVNAGCIPLSDPQNPDRIIGYTLTIKAMAEIAKVTVSQMAEAVGSAALPSLAGFGAAISNASQIAIEGGSWYFNPQTNMWEQASQAETANKMAISSLYQITSGPQKAVENAIYYGGQLIGRISLGAQTNVDPNVGVGQLEEEKTEAQILQFTDEQALDALMINGISEGLSPYQGKPPKKEELCRAVFRTLQRINDGTENRDSVIQIESIDTGSGAKHDPLLLPKYNKYFHWRNLVNWMAEFCGKTHRAERSFKEDASRDSGDQTEVVTISEINPVK